MKRPWIKCGRRIVFFLVLGAIVNFIVALILVVRVQIDEMVPRAPPPQWSQVKPFPDTDEGIEYFAKVAPGMKAWRGRGKRYGIIAEIVEAGWPVVTVDGGAWMRTKNIGNRSVVLDTVRRGAWQLPTSRGIRVIPLHPLWPGFAVNTAFYATILWILLSFSVAIRRRRRTKHGLCPMCAYPVGSNAICTECGKPVTLRCAPAKA